MLKNSMVIASMILLTACGPDIPEIKCMTPDEVGVVKESKDWTRRYDGRGGPYYDRNTTVLVEVKGVVRVCEVNEHAAELLTPGTKVSLINAVRKF